jgi:hypothetical protein
MGRMRKIALVLMIVGAVAAIALQILCMLPYPLSPLSQSISRVREIERGELISFATSHGYKICGEVALSPGDSKAIFSRVFDNETVCLVLFNLPEPKSDYAAYELVTKFILAPVRGEDIAKRYAWHFDADYIGARMYERMEEPFARGGIGVSWDIGRSLQTDVRGKDVFAVFSYKPIDEPNMPVNITITIYAQVLKYWEKPKPPPPPPPEQPPKDREFWTNMLRDVDKGLEDLGYSNCGEYRLDPGRHKLNLTFTFNPYEGKACYVKIMPRELLKQRVNILGGNHSWKPEPVPEIRVRVARVERTGPSFDDPYHMFLMINPAYEMYVAESLPKAFSTSEECGAGVTVGEIGEFGGWSGYVIYVYFSFRFTPDSQVEPRDFKVVYGISLDVEVSG